MKRFIACSILAVLSVSAVATDVDITSFGAVGDGITLNTEAFNKAIEACSQSGGGRVIVPQGTFLTGSIRLKDHIELHVERNACILGSVRIPEDYTSPALIYAEGATDCGISGPGTIDGQSDHPDFLKRFGIALNDSGRPLFVYFYKCVNVTVKDIHLKRSPQWNLRIRECDGVCVDGVSIYSYSQGNNDGIDVEGRNVRIANCLIACEDDGICLKSDNPAFVTEFVTITNCVIASNCNPIKLGTSSFGGFRHVTVSNCVFRRPDESKVWDWSKEYRKVAPGTLTGLAGLAVECVDGGIVENILFDNITMEGIITPIFVCVNHRHGEHPTLKNIRFSGIYAIAEGIIPCLITGAPGSPIEGVTLRDIVVEHAGGEDIMKEPLMENLKAYPENRMYGRFNPAGGLYVRHARNLVIDNFQVSHRETDHRPTVVLDDVQDAMVRDLRTAGSDSSIEVQTINCKNVKN